ncbi:MAG: hypothetical protein Q8R10_09530 [Pseudomonas sp.]|uniref:hypothetical protein n=1 Tax=Pseudomonas sp. TaxID=306 RepID=UPI002736F030|nr:hypothetical protein [Pseudomonas sp.]MDP3846650.1 hypothetical protein [Pseudomonas sp.]
MNREIALILAKIVLSVPVGIGLAYPFIQPHASGGIIGELKIFGPIGSVVAIVVFLLLVFFYALDLIRSLELVSPASRKAKPNSVWFMFLLPYNFIEDFFIVSNVAKSLKAEAGINPALATFKSYGMISGLGWCAAQIISLIPNQVGSVAGVVAIGFWIWHWVFIRLANRILMESGTS